MRKRWMAGRNGGALLAFRKTKRTAVDRRPRRPTLVFQESCTRRRRVSRGTWSLALGAATTAESPDVCAYEQAVNEAKWAATAGLHSQTQQHARQSKAQQSPTTAIGPLPYHTHARRQSGVTCTGAPSLCMKLSSWNASNILSARSVRASLRGGGACAGMAGVVCGTGVR